MRDVCKTVSKIVHSQKKKSLGETDVTLPLTNAGKEKKKRHNPETQNWQSEITSWNAHTHTRPSALMGHILSHELVFLLSCGGRYKFSSPKLRKAQVQALKIQTGRLFLCTKSYTSKIVFSPPQNAWLSEGLNQHIICPNNLHLSKRVQRCETASLSCLVSL